ncbi:glycosyltransferase [Aquincola sp. MAHUQ-54]|uniref:Glycosyltransferase n=1 Tax=Aquincola agrisoli TaxID=3119538 RepID=A0AAW9QI39_9BURK
MIGVVVPAHDEEAVLAGCLAALRQAAGHPALQGEAVQLLVVLDTCTDGSAAAVAAAGVAAIEVGARSVGAARAAGAAALLAQGARWLAFTDADTRVAADWLPAQLALQADAVCGCVAVDDWGVFGPEVQRQYAAHYRDADGHRHVHGANLGVSADAYRRAGGFRPLRCSEDVRLVEDLERTGARIAWSAAPRVVTSARRIARAPGGFADFLRGLERYTTGLAHGGPLVPGAL